MLLNHSSRWFVREQVAQKKNRPQKAVISPDAVDLLMVEVEAHPERGEVNLGPTVLVEGCVSGHVRKLAPGHALRRGAALDRPTGGGSWRG